MKEITISIICFLLILNCTQESNNNAPYYSGELDFGHPRISKNYDTTKMLNYYPFIAYDDGSYMVSAEIESNELFDKYGSIFEKYGYSGTGYCWEGHIKLILEKEKPELLKHISFDPETGGFYLFADSKEQQLIVSDFLSKIFKDTSALQSYIKKANRSRIED